MSIPSWKIWIDTGGTFTDCIAISPEGVIKRLKILSNSVLRGKIVAQPDPFSLLVEVYWPIQKDIFKDFSILIVGQNKISRKILNVYVKENLIKLIHPLKQNVIGTTIEITSHEEVPVLAARLLTETSLNHPFPEIEMKLGSTRGTNAILERKGAKTAFLVTKGFKDLLVIGNQQRADLFTLNIIKNKPLYDQVLEVDERIESNGNVLTPLTKWETNRLINELRTKNIESVAVAFLNSYKNSAHENQMQEALETAGFEFVTSSHKLTSQVKILSRAETTVANAYLAPIIHRYVNQIKAVLAKADFKVMTSAGGLVDANNFYPKDSLLSGPAGGVVGAVTTAKLSGINKLITFDMGGTSTDISLYKGQFDYRYESKVGALKILSPSLAIETIAAGGGSICDFDGYRFTVGPHSAGAYPGPACYGAGGPLTITDVNLLLGRIDPENFSIPLQLDKAEAALKTILAKVKKVKYKAYPAEAVLESLIQIANEKMAEAIKKVSVKHGHDPVEYTLLSFGGAGGQHAIQLAEILGMKKVLIPYDAGLLSAYGIGHSSVERFEERLILKPLENIKNDLDVILKKLEETGKRNLMKSGYALSEIHLHKQLLFLRFKGQENTIEIDYKKGIKITEVFRKKYESVFGHWLESRSIEIESVRVIVAVKGYVTKKKTPLEKRFHPKVIKKQRLFSHGNWNNTSSYKWEDLKIGSKIEGPSIITSSNSTTIVECGWQFLLDENNNALLQQIRSSKRKAISESQEALLELFTNRFTAIAEEMGALLQRTSFSVNVKERLDFSCALLDPEGYLVVNAPHIPVHLGSLGVCVREVLKEIEINEGDVVITNHPAFGGSHLPDVTLIKAVFMEKKIVGYVANRAHHAEIGGKKPGSMPADATLLEEEGIIVSPSYLVKNGIPHWIEIKKIFTEGKYPTRNWEENQADINGALASVNFGEASLKELCKKHDPSLVVSYMKMLRSYASSLLKEKLKQFQSKKFKALEFLDDGSKLNVAIQLKRNKLIIDFSGSSSAHPGNLNATNAIVQSVVLYVLRLLVNKPIPMNEGLMERVKLILPNGLLNPDFKNMRKLPAVVGGNTEVSQRLTDTLLKAFQLAACSQGTMNNFLFGNDHFGYYETVCGGTGAGFGFNGTDAVHQHMTNTRITDPEILELRYPVRLEKFEIRKGSGGKGKWKGGDGVTREIFFKEPLEINILSQHRKEKPYGLKGGLSGKPGKQFVLRNKDGIQQLKEMDSILVNKGDRIVIQTPGGGGYGKVSGSTSKVSG
jgi:5-oxoprolinase (ATP-hydrolysing)